jgi:hypothetical protein
MDAPRLQGRERAVYAALWLENQAPAQRTRQALQEHFRLSRATAYRWYAAWLRAHRALAA